MLADMILEMEEIIRFTKFKELSDTYSFLICSKFIQIESNDEEE